MFMSPNKFANIYITGGREEGRLYNTIRIFRHNINVYAFIQVFEDLRMAHTRICDVATMKATFQEMKQFPMFGTSLCR
jgi:hypothetical protein